MSRSDALRTRRDEPMEQLRMPPQSVEAEQAVLGGLMLSGSDRLRIERVWSEVSDLLTADSFYRRDHALIWQAAEKLVKQGQPIDAVTMGEWFANQGLSEQVAGGAYLIELASTTPSAANIRAYAQIVRDKELLRRVIDVGMQMVNDGFSPEGRDTVEIIGQAQTGVGALMNSQPCELESVAPVMQRVFDRLTERYNRGGGIDGMATGLDDLDELINGLLPGLYVLAARPKMGKTTLAQNIAEHVALVLQKPVAVFPLEMQPEAIGNRMLSSIGDVDAHRIRTGQLDDVDWGNVTNAIRRLRGAQLFVSRPKSARVDHIVAQIRRQHSKTKLGLVVIDYLQLIHAPGDNRAQAIGDISRALVLMAHELGIPVLLLSQLNRDLEKRDDKRPKPFDLRDSGAIEQDADAVIFIYRDEVYNAKSRYKGTAEIIVALQRNGPAGEVRLRYRPDRFRFENLPGDWEPEPMPDESENTKPRKKFGRRGGNAAADAAAGDA
jgi:replicative DNA helicase